MEEMSPSLPRKRFTNVKNRQRRLSISFLISCVSNMIAWHWWLCMLHENRASVSMKYSMNNRYSLTVLKVIALRSGKNRISWSPDQSYTRRKCRSEWSEADLARSDKKNETLVSLVPGSGLVSVTERWAWRALPSGVQKTLRGPKQRLGSQRQEIKLKAWLLSAGGSFGWF